MEQTTEVKQMQGFKQDSVELSRNAKGDYSFKVKVYGDTTESLDDLELRAFALEMRVRQRITAIENADGTQD